MSISLKIKEITKERNLTLKNLAIEIGLSEAGFHKMLKADNFWSEDLVKISRILNIPITRLFSLDDIIPPNLEAEELLNENGKLENRIKELEEQLDDKRKLITYYEQRINSLINVLPIEKQDKYQISNLWEYYLNLSDVEYPLFKKLLLTPLAERGKDFEKEYKEAKRKRKSICEEKLLSDPKIKKHIDNGKGLKDLFRIFMDTDF